MATKFKTSGVNLCGFSPSGKYLAICAGDRVSIYVISDFNAEWAWIRCRHPVRFLQWSPDGEFILCAQYDYGIVQIWCLSQLKWNSCIDEGNLGLVKAIWAPDSRHVFTTAEFYLRLTVWSLVDKRVSYIKNPKNVEMNLICKRDSSIFAVLERKKETDFISVFDCNNCALINQFNVGLRDASGMCLSVVDEVLCIWDSPLYMTVVLFTLSGEMIGRYEDTRSPSRLGLKAVSWSPTGQLVAFTTFDRRVILLNKLTGGLVSNFLHKNRIEDPKTTVFLEAASKFKITRSFTVQEEEKMSAGADSLEFDLTGRFLFTIHSRSRNVVWVWDVLEQNLKFLFVFKENVKVVSCNPHSNALLMCLAGGNVFHWSPESPEDGPKKWSQSEKWSEGDVERVEWNSKLINTFLMKGKTQCQVFTSYF